MEEWGTHPRTLTYGFITLLYFVYKAFQNDEDESVAQNVKRGIYFACLFFLLYCATQLRDGHFSRPHPVVWRVVTGVFILYEMFLIVLLFQRQEDGPKLMVYVDSSLGVELPSRSYGDSCALYTPDDPVSNFRNLRDTILDEFVVMHFIGWFIGALMIRDRYICWLLSIMFEFYEMTFEHWLPNFKECWWDHLFLDILFCNALGIALGMKVCKWFEMKKYDWIGIHDIPNLSGKARRAMQQFTPVSWLPYNWEMLQSENRFWKVLSMVVLLSVMMLNSFFLKTVLWVPASNRLNVYRLAIWYSAGSYAVAEYYIFCRTTQVAKLGPRAWLGCAVVLTEILVIIKFGKDHFTQPFPDYIVYSWAILGLLIVAGSTFYFQCLKQQRQPNTIQDEDPDYTELISPDGSRYLLRARKKTKSK